MKSYGFNIFAIMAVLFAVLVSGAPVAGDAIDAAPVEGVDAAEVPDFEFTIPGAIIEEHEAPKVARGMKVKTGHFKNPSGFKIQGCLKM